MRDYVPDHSFATKINNKVGPALARSPDLTKPSTAMYASN